MASKQEAGLAQPRRQDGETRGVQASIPGNARPQCSLRDWPLAPSAWGVHVTRRDGCGLPAGLGYRGS